MNILELLVARLAQPVLTKQFNVSQFNGCEDVDPLTARVGKSVRGQQMHFKSRLSYIYKSAHGALWLKNECTDSTCALRQKYTYVL